MKVKVKCHNTYSRHGLQKVPYPCVWSGELEIHRNDPNGVWSRPCPRCGGKLTKEDVTDG